MKLTFDNQDSSERGLDSRGFSMVRKVVGSAFVLIFAGTGGLLTLLMLCGFAGENKVPKLLKVISSFVPLIIVIVVVVVGYRVFFGRTKSKFEQH